MKSLSNENKAIENMFSQISTNYDKLNHLLSFGIDRLWRKRLIDKIPSDAERILDLATGTADVALEISKSFNSLIIGADISLSMLKIAKRKDKNGNIQFINAQAEYLPFTDGSFDAVTISFGLRNIPEREKALREMKRVLKNDGILLILEFSHINNILWRGIFELYFLKILPYIGNKISKHHFAYYYLPQTVMKFPAPEGLSDILRDAGFSNVCYDRILGGVAAIHSARSH